MVVMRVLVIVVLEAAVGGSRLSELFCKVNRAELKVVMKVRIDIKVKATLKVKSRAWRWLMLDG